MVYRGSYDGEGITIYHDGVNKGNDTTWESQSPVTPSSIVKIGRLFDEPRTADYGTANVDELVFFNHQLSQSEITKIKNTAWKTSDLEIQFSNNLHLAFGDNYNKKLNQL